MKSKASARVNALIGREQEIAKIRSCLRAGKNVLLEGPVGVGKTFLAIESIRELGRPSFRVDGDNRYSEQKLTGWFDPPLAIKKGFHKDAFIPGPLVEAMKAGGVLFINELNRLPEGVQNVLLPAIDERIVSVPRLGEITAKPGFLVIATQNPKEFVATSHLSEAILDRFELIVLNYQSEKDEQGIVTGAVVRSKMSFKPGIQQKLVEAAVSLIRLTRSHPRVRRGASIRAALSVADIAAVLMQDGLVFESAFLSAALMALPTRIEIEREADAENTMHEELEELVHEWVAVVLKKKT
ncbi:MAG TPA: ATPase [Bdellovibrionales bacterium]|nr:MAG: hypothetical protein A2Z97_05700 [Bdellovibrionales bacterium GWB1_52_6]OFZ04368.1 MAG: hypothetical protein A2X97_06915 [Bdellovibrionales bacterium GWA1_52_35]OFZ36630.1 MAG: hypothetical protein A2070_12525 [Bdellovibrionales bacterium GWC1_52_8]HAR43344.1 ATPase [Bdellovibrionales bacterium]HCM40776.1 ATPase [Bdellovibrionales bacterium]